MKNEARNIILILLAASVLGLVWLKLSGRVQMIESPPMEDISTEREDADYTASFAIFTNGTFRIFTAAMYHNLSEAVYIQADSPNIVHIKKSWVTWGEFFATLPFSVSKTCLVTGTEQTFCNDGTHSLKFFVNGIYDADALDKVIAPGDKLLVSYGPLEENVMSQLDQVP